MSGRVMEMVVVRAKKGGIFFCEVFASYTRSGSTF